MANINPGPASTGTANSQAAQSAVGSTASQLYANLPPASSVPAGYVAYTSDQGQFYSNGTSWQTYGSPFGVVSNASLQLPNFKAALGRIRGAIAAGFTNTASFTGTIAINVLTTSAVTGTINNGASLQTTGAVPIFSPQLFIINQLTGTVGGAGTYQLSQNGPTISSGQTMTTSPPRGRILFLGDSTAAGTGAGSGITASIGLTGAFPNNQQSILAKQLTAAGIPCQNNSFFTDQGTGAVAYGTFDSRVVLGTGWSVYFPILLGAGGFTGSSVSGTLTFTPSSNTDTAIVFYQNYANNSTFTVSLGGGTAQNGTNPAGTLVYPWKTTNPATQTLGANAVVVTVTATQPVIAGVLAYNSTAPAFDLMQWSCVGCTTAPLQPNYYTGVQPVSNNLPQVLAAFQPTLVIIQLTTNDAALNTPLATYTSNIQAAITACKAQGCDVLLQTGVPYSSIIGSISYYAQINSTLKAVAASNNVALTDLFTAFGDYTVATNNGLIYNAQHQLPSGSELIAQFTANFLASI
jgi:lysophospholipase L1-like esterase